MSFEVIAIISPKADKVERVRELFSSIPEKVQSTEPGALRYQVYEQTNAQNGPNDFVIVEEYKDKAAFEHHSTTDHFKALVEAATKEELVARPLDIKFVQKVKGFLSR